MPKSFLKGLCPVLLVAVFLIACQTTSGVEQAVSLETGQPMVFGSVTVFEDGEEQSWTGIDAFLTGGSDFWLVLLPEGAVEASLFELQPGGAFYWSLAPGNYSIAAYDRTIPQSTGPINAQFVVSEGDEPTYIGNLIIDMGEFRYALRVEDEYDSALADFRERFSNTDVVPARSIMQIDAPMGSFTQLVSSCNPSWSIAECNRNHEGVEPISPEASRSFPMVSTLMPTFEWNPSSRDDVSYDLVVWEAARYAKPRAFSPSYVAGRAVVLEEGIEQPRFTLQQPLEPNKRYFWSVRLRDGDVVSTWSRFGYFSFFVFGYSSGFGLSFTLQTPDVGG